MYKKIIILFLLVIMCNCNICFGKSFLDLNESHWGYDAINKMSEAGIISGYPDGTFKSDNPMTRAEFSSILVNSMKLTDTVEYEFIDFGREHWAYNYINIAGNFLYGYKNSDNSMSFEPDNKCVREDVARAIVLATGLDGFNYDLSVLSNYSDKSFMDKDLEKYIAIAIQNKLMVGNANGTFNPKGTLTRAEVTALLLNISTQGLNQNLSSALRPNGEGGFDYTNSEESDSGMIDETIIKVVYEKERILLFDINGNECNEIFGNVEFNEDSKMTFENFIANKSVKMVEIQEISSECDKAYDFELISISPLCIKVTGNIGESAKVSYILKLYF